MSRPATGQAPATRSVCPDLVDLVKVSQSALIVGALLAGFVLYLAANKRLGTYAGALFGPVQTASAAGQGAKTTAQGAGAAARAGLAQLGSQGPSAAWGSLNQMATGLGEFFLGLFGG